MQVIFIKNDGTQFMVFDFIFSRLLVIFGKKRQRNGPISSVQALSTILLVVIRCSVLLS